MSGLSAGRAPFASSPFPLSPAPLPDNSPGDHSQSCLLEMLSTPTPNPRALFLTNLLLLGFDPTRPIRSSMLPYSNSTDSNSTEENEHETPLDADMFGKGGMAGTAKAFESTARFLFGVISASEAREVS